MENFAKLKKKELIDIYFINNEKTEKLNITLLRTVSRYARLRRDYYIVIVKYPLGFDKFGTLFHERYKVEGNVIEELKQAIKKYAEDMVLESIWIDKKLKAKAKILCTSEDKFEEHLEKLSKVIDKV
jgi:hypothetical protein